MASARVALLLLGPYVAWLVFSYEYHFLDGVNLAFHEAGHLFFAFFGQTLQFLGGTLGQLFFPLACWLHFRRRGDEVGARVCLLWLAESGMYAAHYMGDARAQNLPLVGGHIHDWNWLLTRAGLLEHCESLAAGLHGLCGLFAVYVLVGLAKIAFATPEHLAETRPTGAMPPRMMSANPPPAGDPA